MRGRSLSCPTSCSQRRLDVIREAEAKPSGAELRVWIHLLCDLLLVLFLALLLTIVVVVVIVRVGVVLAVVLLYLLLVLLRQIDE